ncbi:MAG TPA: hypothetical protein PKW35_01840 [Nannocystaceae bacterium]|nr:hypothetical protein [Nannocystaceae bacterium]
MSGAELVEGDAEGVEVEAGIGGDEAGFGGDVAGGADDATAVGGARRRFGARDEGGREEVGDAVVGGVCRRGIVGGRDDGGRQDRGDAEVDELDAGAASGALEGDDVAGLDVAVDDAGAMEGDEGVGDLEGDLEGVAPGEGAAAEVLVEAGARECSRAMKGAPWSVWPRARTWTRRGWRTLARRRASARKRRWARGSRDLRSLRATGARRTRSSQR